MARKCKDCPQSEEEIIESEVVEEEQQKEIQNKSFFFPNEWVRIEADTYEEALTILHSLNN